MPISRRIAFDAALSSADERAHDDARTSRSGRATARGDGLGVDDRVDLRHLLADGDVERGGDEVGERDRDGDRRAVRERPRRAAARSAVAIAGSPRKPMPSEASVMPSWQADRYCARGRPCWRDRAGARRACPRRACSSMRARARAHERELGGDEEPVDAGRARGPRRAGARSWAGGAGGRYFEEGRRHARSPRAVYPRPAVRAQAPARASIARGELEVGLVRPPSLCVESVSRTLFQPWTRMSGWWFAASAASRDAVDERHRRGEVRELEVAHERRRPAAPGPPATSVDSSAERAIPASLRSPDAHRQPRPPRHRAAVRARTRRPRRRRHPRVRLPAGRARPAQGHARRARRRASARARSTPPCASGPRAASRSTSSTRSALRELEPDLIVTQALCPVCAVASTTCGRSPSG